MIRTVFLTFVLLILAGCTQFYPHVLLRHPKTGDMVDCTNSSFPLGIRAGVMGERMEVACTKTYTELGYERVK